MYPMEAISVNRLYTLEKPRSISRQVFYDSLILLVIQFIGALLGIEIVSIVGVSLFSLYIAYKYKDGCYAVVLIAICLLVFLNFVIGLGAHIGHNRSANLSFLTQVATLFIFINALYILLSDRLDNKMIFVLFIMVMLLFL